MPRCFVACAAIGPAIVMWSQRVLYGGFLVPGYVGWGGFFNSQHILHNLSFYPRQMSAVHTPLVFLGLAGAIRCSAPPGNAILTPPA